MPEAVQDPALAKAFAAYAETRMAEASNLEVTQLARIHGGASRETFSVDIAFDGPNGRETKGLILRKDPPDSLIDTDRKVEFAAIRSMTGAGIPAPDALFLEPDQKHLGAPFFVMGRIEGGVPVNPFRIEEVEPHRQAIGEQFFRHLGSIARVDPATSPLADEIETPSPDACWKRELDYWENEIDTNARAPQPISKAAIRHLRRAPPPPAQRLSIVHGDYRSGNYLHDGAGAINAVLDWEMAHIGDPYEDLAWATDPLWSGTDMELAAGLLPWPEAIAIWQESSGCTFDPAAFEWWSIFASVKAMGIWISSARAYADGKNDDPILAWSGWFTHCAHELTLASRLAPKYGVEMPS
ncbi:MAG: phosphotransferase family protein [Pseudomonadota bacterium]